MRCPFDLPGPCPKCLACELSSIMVSGHHSRFGIDLHLTYKFFKLTFWDDMAMPIFYIGGKCPKSHIRRSRYL